MGAHLESFDALRPLCRRLGHLSNGVCERVP